MSVTEKKMMRASFGEMELAKDESAFSLPSELLLQQHSESGGGDDNTMSTGGGAHNTQEVLHHFSPDMILGVMAKRASSVKVQWKCCKLIIKMTYKQKQTGAAFLLAGAAEAIVQAMEQFPDHRDLQFKGCAALRNLTCNKEKMRIVDAGGVESVINAMKLFPNDEDLQEDACCCLYNLASSSHSRIKSTIKAKGGTVVLADAERRFLGTDCLVEKKARKALERLYLV